MPADEHGRWAATPDLALYVRTDARSLEIAQSNLTMLATQAGLALQRINLHERLIRQAREEYFRTLVQKSTDVILILDDDNRIRYASPSATTLASPGPVAGSSILDLVDPGDRTAAAGLLHLVRARGDRATTGPPGRSVQAARRDWIVHRTDGTAAHVEAACRDLRTDPSIAGLVLTLRDVTEQRRLEEELAQRAFHDPLTGLSNRLLFDEQLNNALHNTGHDGYLSAVLYIDVDDLKLVNDGLGHGAGDTVIATVANRLTDFVSAQTDQPGSTASRLGGDEFAVLLSAIPDQDSVDAAAEHLTAALAEPVHIGETELTCPSSVGIATTDDAATAQDLLRDADLALYAAKASGKQRWRRYEPWMHTTLMARLSYERRSPLPAKTTSSRWSTNRSCRCATAPPSGSRLCCVGNTPRRGRPSPGPIHRRR